MSLDSPADGIYCSTVGITVTHLGGIHALTLVAPIVNIPPGSGNNNFVLTPYNAGLDAANKDLVLWQYGSGRSFEMNGNNSAFNGVVWIQERDLDLRREQWRDRLLRSTERMGPRQQLHDDRNRAGTGRHLADRRRHRVARRVACGRDCAAPMCLAAAARPGIVVAPSPHAAGPDPAGRARRR